MAKSDYRAPSTRKIDGKSYRVYSLNSYLAGAERDASFARQHGQNARVVRLPKSYGFGVYVRERR